MPPRMDFLWQPRNRLKRRPAPSASKKTLRPGPYSQAGVLRSLGRLRVTAALPRGCEELTGKTALKLWNQNGSARWARKPAGPSSQIINSAMATPRRPVRSASQGGTVPEYRDRSAVPELPLGTGSMRRRCSGAQALALFKVLALPAAPLSRSSRRSISSPTLCSTTLA